MDNWISKNGNKDNGFSVVPAFRRAANIESSHTAAEEYFSHSQVKNKAYILSDAQGSAFVIITFRLNIVKSLKLRQFLGS